MVAIFNCSRENRLPVFLYKINSMLTTQNASQSATVRLSKMYNKAAHRMIFKELEDCNYVVLHI